MEDESLEIVELVAENFKRLKAVRIVPTKGEMVKLVGKNGHGKTSILDAIAAAIGGKDYLPEVPVRRGAEDGFIKLNLGSLVVKLKFDRERLTQLTVTDADGKRKTTPQKVLDKLATELTLDPMEFMAFKASERIDAIKRLIPGFDFAANARDRQEAYNTRTDVGRDYRRDKALLDSLPLQPQTKPEQIDTAQVLAELQLAEVHNSAVRDAAEKQSAAVSRIAHKEREIAGLKAQLRHAVAELMTLQEELDELAPVLAPIELDKLHHKIGEAASINRTAEQFDRYVALQSTLDGHQVELRRLDEKITDLDGQRVRAVQAAKLPVEGLGFGEDDVTIDGLPFEQASGSEQLMVATAITMALRPTLKVILLRQGPLLDPEHLTMLAKFSASRGYQLWCERLDDGVESGIIIEDGEVYGTRT